MAQQRLAAELAECRLCFPEHAETDLGECGVRFRHGAETMYLTFAPPRQERPAYRWVCGRFDLIFGELSALVERRALLLEVLACVEAIGATEVTPLDGNPHGYELKAGWRHIRFIHRSFESPSYTYYEDGYLRGEGVTLDAALAGGVFQQQMAAPDADVVSAASQPGDGLLDQDHQFNVDDALDLMGGDPVEGTFDETAFGGDRRRSSSVGPSGVLNAEAADASSANGNESSFDPNLLDASIFDDWDQVMQNK